RGDPEHLLRLAHQAHPEAVGPVVVPRGAAEPGAHLGAAAPALVALLEDHRMCFCGCARGPGDGGRRGWRRGGRRALPELAQGRGPGRAAGGVGLGELADRGAQRGGQVGAQGLQRARGAGVERADAGRGEAQAGAERVEVGPRVGA
ncbi:MAG: hypothetical protein ACK559_08700, partial [bacterium]